jgi:hypothetical protein
MNKPLRPLSPPADSDSFAGIAAPSRGINSAARSPTSSQTCVVTVYDSLSALPARYEPLFSSAGDASVFFTLPWFNNYVQTVLAPHERLRIYAAQTAEPDATPLAVLVMSYDASASKPFRLRSLNSLANYYTSLFGAIVSPGQPDAQHVLDALASAISRDSLRWDEIDLHPLALDEPYFSGLMTALRKAGLLAHSYFCFGNWYLEVNNRPYEAYLKTRPSRLAKTGARMRRNLEKGTSFRFELFTGIDRVEQGITDYNVVYNSSWKVQEPHPNFMPGLIRTCAAQGWLRLGVAYMDGEPAAAQLWVVVGEQASIYKMAYDERFAKQSIGTVLSSLLMQHVIEVDKVKVVDYLTGDDSYKRDWMDHRRERWGIRAFNPRTAQGLIAAARHVGGSAMRRAINAVRKPQAAKT